jgi:lipopolysaccharide/colanic/teichoic acid biosynthesis glycosyltransferase
VIFVRFQPPGLRAWARRVGDFVAACALIAFTLPLMAIVAIAIKCDSLGPVFERRQCVGIGGRRFDALSFRTTLHAVEDADLTWHRVPHMTRVGPYLRYTRVDDLPQLFNVLRGEMSIIDSVAYSPSFLD